MSFIRESSVERAKNDLAARLGIEAAAVTLNGVTDREFPDSSLGTPVDGEVAAMMISSGWSIDLEANGKEFEYRADKYQLRLAGFEGENHIVD